jgi:splicing factor 3B subunit 3
VDLDENEAAFSVAVVPFAERGGEIMLVVGTAVEVTIAPRTCSKGFLRLYKISEDGRSIEFLNKVSLPEVYRYGGSCWADSLFALSR